MKEQLKRIISWSLLLLLVGGIVFWLLPSNQEEITTNPEPTPVEDAPEQPTPEEIPLPAPTPPETDPQQVLITEILLGLDAWQTTAPKSVKKVLKQTIKSLTNPQQALATQINDLAHLLTHYGKEQTHLKTQLTKLKEFGENE